MKRITLSIMVLLIAGALNAQSYQLNRAKSLIDNKQYTEAAKTLRPLADGGDAEAQYLAAMLFKDGNGVVKSKEQSDKYLQMAVRQYHIEATLELCRQYAHQDKWQQAYDLYSSCYANNAKAADTEIVFFLGQLTFNGLGCQQDMEQGWETMYTFMTKKEKNEANRRQCLEYMKDIQQEFYRHLVDKYLNNPEMLLQCMAYKYDKELGCTEWVDNTMEYLVNQLNTLSFEMQTKHYKAWMSTKEVNLQNAFLRSIMLAQGIGTKRYIQAAKAWAWALVGNDLTKLPYMEAYVNKFIRQYEVGENIAGVGKVAFSEGGSYVVYENGTRKTYSADALFAADKAARNRTAEHTRKKNNIVGKSDAPQIKLNQVYAKYQGGGTEVTFCISLKAMNKCRLTVLDGSFTRTDNTRSRASTKVSGLKSIGSTTNLLMPGETAYVTVLVPKMPSEGELKEVKVGISTNYGKGFLTATDVVW